MSKNVAQYYQNSICFEDTRKLKLMSNWFDEKYKNIYIAIDACKDLPDKPKKCKPLTEIKKFINE